MTLSDPPAPFGSDRLRPVLEGCASGALPPNIAVMQLAMHAAGPEEVETRLAQACAAAGRDSSVPDARTRMDAALRLWRENPQAFEMIKTVLDGVDHGGGCLGPDHWARVFDRMAAASPDGSVALYALGNPDLLRAATEEVVERLAGWDLLGQQRRVLEIGCGIGRLLSALSSRVGSIRGIDISPRMIAAARTRCAGLANVSVGLATGRDLAGVADGSVDLLLACDVFPYVVQAGADAVDRHVAEAARVLAQGGHLAILNFSYRGDFARDRDEAEALCERHGLVLGRAAQGDFTLWDAATFLLAKP